MQNHYSNLCSCASKKSQIIVDLLDPYATAVAFCRSLPFRLAWRSGSFQGGWLPSRMHPVDERVVRSALWRYLAGATWPNDVPVSPRAADVDEVLDAVVAVAALRSA